MIKRKRISGTDISTGTLNLTRYWCHTGGYVRAGVRWECEGGSDDGVLSIVISHDQATFPSEEDALAWLESTMAHIVARVGGAS